MNWFVIFFVDKRAYIFLKVAEFIFQHQARVIYVCSEYVIS